MAIKKYKLIFAIAVTVYSFFVLFHPLLHSHPIDAKDHDDCFACNWDLCVQATSNTPEILLAITFLMFLFLLPSTSYHQFIASGFSSRAPPFDKA
jgi:hypothetical protein